MATATLTFDLDNHDDRMAHLRCVKSLDMAIALFDITHNLKKKCDHICESMEADSDQFDGVYTTFQQIAFILEENGINMNELIE